MAASVRSHPSSPGDESDRRLFWQRVARLAAYAFRVPLALVRVGDVSASAVREEDGPAPTPADLRVLVQQLGPVEALLVVEDTAKDERLASQEREIRFVAALPIRGIRRQPVGVLSLGDTRPRVFSEVDVGHLRMLVALVIEAHLHPLEGATRGPSLQRIVQQMDHSIVVTDPDGRIAWVNEGFERLCGYTLDELHGRKPRDLLHGPQTDPEVLATMREHVQAGTRFSTEVVNYRKTGEPYWVHIQAEPVEEDGVTGFIAFETEIGERKAQEEALQTDRDVLAAAVDTGAMLVVLLDHEARIVRFNAGCRRATGYTAEEVIGEPVVDFLVPEEERAEVNAIMDAHRAGQRDHTFTCHWIIKTGERRRIDWSSTVLTDAEGAVQHIIGTGVDVTAQWQLREYALQVSDAEQRRIGQALRDLLASQLMGTAMMTRGLERRFERRQTVTGQDLHTLVDQIQETASRIRMLSHRHFPDPLRSRDVEGALRQLAAAEEELAGITVSLAVDPGLPALDEAAATHLYRIAYEAIHNAHQYAGADRVWVHLTSDEGHVVLTIRDDGRGPPEAGALVERMRLRLMHQRAEMIGADLSVQRAEQGGTVVRCVVPAGKAEERE